MESFFTSDDENLKWNELDSRTLLNTPVFDVTERNSVSAGGMRGDYIVVNARDWVITLPVKGENFLMVKQWRHGEKALSVEFPGGVIERGEAPEKAAARELLEETGFAAGNLTRLGSFNPNPALFSNHVHVFLAESLEKTGGQSLDSDEFINCIEISVEDVIRGMGTPEFPHALMASALSLYLKNKILSGNS